MGRENTLQCVSSALLEAPAERGVEDFSINDPLCQITWWVFLHYPLFFSADNVASVLGGDRVSLPAALIPSVLE